MTRPSRAERRRQGFKLPPMRSVSLRIPVEIWEKLGWLAIERNRDKSEVIRDILEHGTRNARDPESRKHRRIRATEAEWQAWEDMAEHMGVTIDDLVTTTMRRLHVNKFGADIPG